MKILRKKKCGFTIIEILVVLSIIAALIGIAGKRLMPRNPLENDDILKIRDFIEKCVFECRTGSLRFFKKHKFVPRDYKRKKDLIEEEFEFFASGIIDINQGGADIGCHVGKLDCAIIEYFQGPEKLGMEVLCQIREPFNEDGGSRIIALVNRLVFKFPKFIKKIKSVERGIFSIKDRKFSTCFNAKVLRDIDAGGLSIRKKGDTFDWYTWNTFFDGCFITGNYPYFNCDGKCFCLKFNFHNGEKWCFYVDDLCICHSVRVK